MKYKIKEVIIQLVEIVIITEKKTEIDEDRILLTIEMILITLINQVNFIYLLKYKFSKIIHNICFKDIGIIISNELKMYAPMIGFGVP